MHITEAVGHLQRAHAAAGLGHLCAPAPGIESQLERIADAIAPLRLPEELAAFWLLVDPDSLALAPWPRPAGPALALRLWRAQRVAGGLPSPAMLFPWGYDSHAYLYAELGDREAPGGSVFARTGPDAPYTRTFPSVTAYVDLLAMMIQLGEFAHHRELGVLEFDPGRRWDEAQLVRAATDPVHPRHGLCRIVAADPAGWPAHWRSAEGLQAGSEVTGSCASTVAALLDRARSGEAACGVIRARVTDVCGAGSGSRVEVSDGTGRLDVWCPPAVCTGGLVIDHSYDFEVSLRPGCEPGPDMAAGLSGVERATRAGDFPAAVALATPLYDRLFGTPATAQARAIRPAG